MLAAPRSEPVAEPQELRLVDRREDRHHRRLDDLVLDGGDAERPLPAIGLWDVPPARRQALDSAPVDARVEISEVLGRGLPRIRPMSRSSTPGAARFFRLKKACPQDVDRDVMQERRELLLLVPGDGFSYAILRL